MRSNQRFRGRAKLTDVARLAGVSLGSASRALSNPDTVTPKTLKTVSDAAAALNYVPDGAARMLALGRSQTIGVILPTVNNPVYAQFVHSAQRFLAEKDFHLLVSAHEYNRDAEVELVARLTRHGVDGLLLIGTDHHPEVLRNLSKTRTPYLYLWSTDGADRQATVGFSNRRAIHQVVHHLASLGHQQFAVISGDLMHNERAAARIDGITDVMMVLGLPLPPERIITAPFSIEGGRAGFRRAMQLSPVPTAIICSTDLAAIGAIAEATGGGLRVPEDVSISGFDDIDIASAVTPGLTTVRVPVEEMAQRSSGRILAMIAGEDTDAMEPPLTCDLVIRSSTGAVSDRRVQRGGHPL